MPGSHHVATVRSGIKLATYEPNEKTGRSEILVFPTGLFVVTKTFPPIERNSLQLPSKTGYFQTGFNNLAA
jgi:hypothetical protein